MNTVGRSVNVDKKDVIEFGDIEILSDLRERFWWGDRARLAMAEVNRDVRHGRISLIWSVPEL